MQCKSPVIARVSELDAWVDSRCHARYSKEDINTEVAHLASTLSDVILRSPELQSKHALLVNEVSATLASLVAACHQMTPAGPLESHSGTNHRKTRPCAL